MVRHRTMPRAPAVVLALTATLFLAQCRVLKGPLSPRGVFRSTARAAVRTAIAYAIWTELTEDQWKEERAAAKEERKGLEQYEGPRVRIANPGAKVAAMPLSSQDIEPRLAFVVDDLLLTELTTAGFEAIGPEDINQMLGFERMKEEAGCDDPSCYQDVGSALGVPYLTAGNLATVEGSTVVTLKLMNVEESRVVARVSRIAEGEARVLPRVIAEAVQEMVSRSGL